MSGAAVERVPHFTRPGEEPVPLSPPLPGSVLPPPDLCYNVRRRCWELREAYEVADGRYTLTIPAGFTLDLSSIPRVLWPFVSSFELGEIAPLAHDFLYAHRGEVVAYTRPARIYSRHEADKLFKELMRAEGVRFVTRHAAYRAVRMFGWMGRGRW